MSSYVLSAANRWYVAREQEYGRVAAVSSKNRIPALRLTVRQELERRERRDKTGSRTFWGLPAGLRRRTSFTLRTYMTGWLDEEQEPAHGPLFEAALGSGAERFAGGTTASGSTEMMLRFREPHGLTEGQAIRVGGQLRFVTSVVDAWSVMLNAPLAKAPLAGTAVGATVSYRPAMELPSASIYDYWTPATAVQRILCGSAIDSLRIRVNADFHEFEFHGAARDVIDSASFEPGQGGLMEFPAEPVGDGVQYSIIAGNVGEAWFGPLPHRFCTVTEAEIVLRNDLQLRDREFGCELPQGVSAGMRTVSAELELYEMDDAATKALYQAARQRSPISLMFQLGGSAGHLFGVYLRSVVPEVPQFDDSEIRLRWRFDGCRAQGTIDDEIYVAFA